MKKREGTRIGPVHQTVSERGTSKDFSVREETTHRNRERARRERKKTQLRTHSFLAVRCDQKKLPIEKSVQKEAVTSKMT